MFDDLYEIARGSADPPDLLLRLHVQPGAGRSAVVGRHGDALKVKVGAPPEGGRANEAVLGLLASALGVDAAALTLESGATSRAKRDRIRGLGPDQLERRLEAAVTSGNAGGRRGVVRSA